MARTLDLDAKFQLCSVEEKVKIEATLTGGALGMYVVCPPALSIVYSKDSKVSIARLSMVCTSKLPLR